MPPGTSLRLAICGEQLRVPAPTPEEPYVLVEGDRYREWHACIDLQVGKLRRALHGNVRPVRDGVWELRIDMGPGYRVYFGRFQRPIGCCWPAETRRASSAISTEP